MTLRTLLLVFVVLIIAPGLAQCQDVGEESNSSAEAATTGRLISDVPALKWDDGMCMFMGVLNTTLNYLGKKTTYDYLMGTSGAAFATRFHPAWRVTSADAALTDDHPKAAMQAVGYDYAWSTTGDASAVVDAIDKGLPVIAIDPTGHGDWGIIVGYEHSGEVWLSRTYYSKPTEYHKTEKLPWNLFFIGKSGEQPNASETIRNSITLAVEFGQGKRKIREYAVGFAAYEAWIKALQPDAFKNVAAKQLEEQAFANAWIYNSLISARYSAVAHLGWVAGQLKNEEDRANCEAAKKLYLEEIDILRGAKDYVKYPQYIKTGPKWTAEMRAYEAEALRLALEKDRTAITALEKLITRTDKEAN